MARGTRWVARAGSAAAASLATAAASGRLVQCCSPSRSLPGSPVREEHLFQERSVVVEGAVKAQTVLAFRLALCVPAQGEGAVGDLPGLRSLVDLSGAPAD